MRYRKLSPTGDFVFGNGLRDFYVDEPLAVGQAVQTTLKLFLGEWFLDNTVGVPYPEGVLGKHSQAEADSVVQTATLAVQAIAVPGGGNVNVVTDISNFTSSINPDTRGYSPKMNIDTVFGPTQVEIENATNF